MRGTGRAARRARRLLIWRVYGDASGWYARPAGEASARSNDYPVIGTVTAYTEADAIARMYDLVWAKVAEPV